MSAEIVLNATPEQQLLSLLCRVRRDGRLLNVTRSFSLYGPVDSEKLHESLMRVAFRHDALRTRRRHDGARLRLVVGTEPDVEWDHRLERTAPEARSHRAQALAEQERNLEARQDGPAVAVRLVELGGDTAYLGVRLNHLVADARSMVLVLREVGAAYRGETGAADPVQFSEHVARQQAWIESPAARRAAECLRETMRAGQVVVPPPPDGGDGADGVRDVELVDRVGGSVDEAARRMRVLPSAVYFAACGWALADVGGTRAAADLLVGSVFANRGHRGLQETVGTFAQLVPVPVHVGARPSPAEVAAAAQRGIATALSYQSYPSHRVPGVKNDDLSSHVFQVVDATEQPLRLPAPVRCEELCGRAVICRFPFESVVTLGSTPRLRLVWQGGRVDPSWVDAYERSFVERLSRLVEAS